MAHIGKKKKIPEKKIYYTWKQFDKDVTNFVRRLKYAKYNPKTIVALARGGLPFGVKLSHMLDTHLMIVSVKSYEGQKSSNTMLVNSSYTVPLRSPILLVDEVADTGKTLQVIKEHFESLGVEVRTVTLFYKEHSVIKPNWYMHRADNNKWLVFPWERS